MKMPHKDPEVRRQYHKEYREKNKERIKEYRDTHREEKQAYNEKNKERNSQTGKRYRQTETGKKNYRINCWKLKGVICDDFDALYDKYMSTFKCGLCDVEITSGGGLVGKKHLDHDHKTGEFRQVICGMCNVHKLMN